MKYYSSNDQVADIFTKALLKKGKSILERVMSVIKPYIKRKKKINISVLVIYERLLGVV